jgi:hypothetical protein
LEERPDPAWLREPVSLQPPRGLVRYLLDVSQERCCECDTGTRTLSVWATTRGRGELVSWCGHCFNASCDPIALEEGHRRRLQILQETLAVPEGRPDAAAPWKAVRPALDDLRRRGLLR